MKTHIRLIAAASILILLASALNASALSVGDVKKWLMSGGEAQKAFYTYEVVGPISRMIFIYSNMGAWMVMYGNSFSDHFQEIILANPSLNASSASYNPEIVDLMSVSIRLLLPAYLLTVVLTAFYMLFMSASPEGRFKAKALLQRLFISMIFLSLSPLIVQAMLDTSQYMSQAIIDQSDTAAAKEILQGGIWGAYWITSKIGMTDLELAIGFWTSIYVMAWMPYLIVSLRYIMVVMYSILFPIGIVLYSFVVFRGLGRKILEQSMLWIFMQVFFALIIMTIGASASFYNVLPDQDNIVLSGVNILPVPFMDQIFTEITSLLKIPFFSTNIIAFTLGSASYGLFFAVPFMMLRLLHKFLP